MKNLLVLLISFAILSNVSIAWSQSGDNTQCDDPTSSLLWQVKGKNSTVYLFGTLHFGKASFYPLADEIETAFRKADHLVFEIDANKAQEAEFAIKMQQLGLYPPGQSLADAISKESLEQVITVSRDLGLPRETLLQFRPWFLTLSLTAQHLVGLGYLPDYGIESYLGREKSSATQLQELESLDEQLKFMQKLDSEAYLTLTLDTLDQGEDLLQGLAHAWECADKQLLQELLV